MLPGKGDDASHLLETAGLDFLAQERLRNYDYWGRPELLKAFENQNKLMIVISRQFKVHKDQIRNRHLA
jgi:hypothetical protein